MVMQWTKRQISTVVIVALTSFMGTFLISSVNIALPAIGMQFNLSAVSLSWIIISFLLSTSMFLIPVGRWADVFGIHLFFKIGIVVFTLSSLLLSFVKSEFFFIVLRFVQGIGAAFTNTTGSAILVSSFLPQYRGRVLGMSVSSVYMGLAMGPFVGGIITQYFGWHGIFLLSTFIGFICIILAFFYLKHETTQKLSKKPFELPELLLYMLGLFSLVFGSSKIPSTIGWVFMIAGIIVLVMFWNVEKRIESPIFDTKFFTENRLFAFSNLAALINYSATYAIVFLLSLYLQKIKGLTPKEAGSILIAQPVMMAVFSPIMGRLSDKFQPRYLATIGMTMCAIGLFMFSLLSLDTPIFLIILTLIWIGLGFAFFSSPNMNTIMSAVKPHQYGLASGSASTMRVVGQITSMTIATIYFALLFGKNKIDNVQSSQFLSAIHYGFFTFFVLTLPGIYFSYFRGDKKS